MKHYPVIVLIVLMSLMQIIHAQGIEGRISNSSGNPVPFASIFVPSLHKGTTANEKGFYILPLPNGSYSIVFQYLGYKSLNVDITTEVDFQQINVVLQQQEYMLPEVIVTASGEDPAYYVMRKAIGMSQYYRNQVTKYSANVYLKGSGIATNIPTLLKPRLKKEGLEEGKYYVTETLSEITYTLGEPLQTKVTSIRSNLPGNEASPMQFMALSLYNDMEGLISPLSKDAFTVYRFKLEGTFLEGNNTIHKIRVIPKRKGNDLYNGIIFIREGSWSLHSVQLSVKQNLFEALIRQVYHAVEPMVWMPVSHDYDLKISLMGVDFSYRYMVTVSDYKIQLNNKLDHNFYAKLAEDAELTQFNNVKNIEESKVQISKKDTKIAQQQRITELMDQNSLSNREMRELNQLIRMESKELGEKPSLEIKSRNTEIADSARARPDIYWKQNRPVPLTLEEQTSFLVSDTIKESSDSTKKKNNSFASKLLMGGTVWKDSTKKELIYDGLFGLNSFNYNTVDGFTYMQRLRFRHVLKPGHNLSFMGSGKYAFARMRLMGTFGAKIEYAPMRRGMVSLTFGRETRDFNEVYGIHPLLNGVTSLFFKQNILKLYEEDFVEVLLKEDIINGLEFNIMGKFYTRSELFNSTDFYLTNPWNNNFTSNLPGITNIDSTLVGDVRSGVITAGLYYTPFQYFRIVQNRKRVSHSAYPTFGFNWKMGMNSRESGKNTFHALTVSIKQQFESRLYGRFEYMANAGSFFGDNPLHYADYKHFNTNSTWVGPYQQINSFRGLNPYERSTTSPYIELHGRYEHARILFKRLPFLAGSLMRESLFVNHLSVQDEGSWTEFGYGVQQLFLLFNAEIFTGFESGKYKMTGLRIGIPIGEATIRM